MALQLCFLYCQNLHNRQLIFLRTSHNVHINLPNHLNLYVQLLAWSALWKHIFIKPLFNSRKITRKRNSEIFFPIFGLRKVIKKTKFDGKVKETLSELVHFYFPSKNRRKSREKKNLRASPPPFSNPCCSLHSIPSSVCSLLGAFSSTFSLLSLSSSPPFPSLHQHHHHHHQASWGPSTVLVAGTPGLHFIFFENIFFPLYIFLKSNKSKIVTFSRLFSFSIFFILNFRSL